ncbi:hypothetical protein [Glutamicibacter uratoxydans]
MTRRANRKLWLSEACRAVMLGAAATTIGATREGRSLELNDID